MAFPAYWGNRLPGEQVLHVMILSRYFLRDGHFLYLRAEVNILLLTVSPLPLLLCTQLLQNQLFLSPKR